MSQSDVWRRLVVVSVMTSLVAGADERYPEAVMLAPDGGDTYAVAERIDIREPVAGDLVAAGSIISVGAEVAADIIAAGRRIKILAPVGDPWPRSC